MPSQVTVFSPGYSNVMLKVSGHSYSSFGCGKQSPPPETTRFGNFTPSAHRATSRKCGALLPLSAVPQRRNQCQL